MVQEQSRLTDIEILLQSMLPVGSVKEADVPPPDNFDWVVPPYDLDMIFPRPELDEESLDVERDVCDVPDEFPVGIDKAVVEPLCLPEVVLTRPQVGCDPDLPLPVAVVPLVLPVVVQTRPQVGCGPDLPLPCDERMGVPGY